MTGTATPTEPAPQQRHGDDPLRTAVVVNPNRVEGTEELRAQITEQLAAAGWPAPAWLETTADDPGTGQARQAVEDGVDVVLVCGGDGTVRAVVEGLVGTDTALAVLPGGTGNLLAANLDVPTNVPDGVDTVLQRGRRQIDVGRADGQVFAVMAGMGLDAATMDDAPTKLKNRAGSIAYVFSALKHLADDEMRVEVVVDGGPPLRRHARSVLIGNVGRLQGGVTLLPDAQPDTGVMEVAIIAPRNVGHWLQLLVGIALRRSRVPRREMLRGAHVVVRCDRPQPRQLDGDVLEPGRTLEVKVEPSSLWVCVHQPDSSPDLAEGGPSNL
ncbi:diacylglycerol/lipid kinase family protein [Cellulomonas fimi]|uniref:Diacylglycerol kinase catalytic region n=1 Tax=Cellulomonas fimi (strain ATCC 484 / DSM 20113 / JCM 1341 / CCUG 24087 / LMG 16345 / NBRC 15513 / NCIMB 8980 / NCTC 7547 / NRS-133) TaxID=590998 RepID=F4H2T1_CELFA|nr:diacylglycerol kinase family protein [Cellulomonas fimi]AEE46430.1 diacylglycerol kinase catalytic region [Cellulomonas fimi ATCC 484]NNH09202.1 diacylglycerol kinase [Cellulomonas fimi]VEH32967.1 Diacylglycerol kinase [Cellulomonas fimi]